jgi:Mn-dependent DtxR family transcriptional regulator
MKNFAMIPIELFEDTRLTHRDFKVLAALYSFRKKGTQVVFPKRETLSKRAGVSIENVSRTTTRLEKLGLLIKEGNGGKSRATRYTLIAPSNSVKNDTVTNGVKNDMVSSNHVKKDRGIEHTLSPTPASARRSPRSGVEPFADVGVGKEVIKEIKRTTKPIIFGNDDPVKDNNEYSSSLDAKPNWAIDLGLENDKKNGNADPFSAIQQTTVSPPPLPLRDDTAACNKPTYEWEKNLWFKSIIEIFPHTTPAQLEIGYAAYLEWIEEGRHPKDILFNASRYANAHKAAADFLYFFSSISVMDQYTPKKL